MAFGFHDANSDTVGNGGAGLGLGGIPDAIGWKADTTYNWATSNDATADPAEFSNSPRKPNTTDFSGGKLLVPLLKVLKKLISRLTCRVSYHNWSLLVKKRSSN